MGLQGMRSLTVFPMDAHTIHPSIHSSTTLPKYTTEVTRPSFSNNGVTSMAPLLHTLLSKSPLPHLHLHLFLLKVVVPPPITPSTAQRSIKQEGLGLEGGTPTHSSQMEVSTHH